MHAKSSELPRHSRPGILAADQPLVVPMILRISDLKLRGIVVLVVSKTKGVTLVFKNDPLESIRISSTFDSVSILRDFLQRQIETQLRNMLQEDLPVMIHNLSLRFIQSEAEKQKKKEQEERIKQLEETNSIRLRSWTNSTTDFCSLPELDFPSSPTTSTLYTPLSSSFDLNEDYHNYLSCSPTSTVFTPLFSETTDFKKNEFLNIEPNDYFHCSTSRAVPITAANLFTHNRSMNQLGISAYKEYHPMNHLIQLQHQRQRQDLISEGEMSSVTATTPCLSMADIYADDADAPWYAVEGPELFSSTLQVYDMTMHENILLNPSENGMAARLFRLTSVNYTLSPLLAENISNFTFRSLPHIKKSSNSCTPRHKKIPKRRVTRLSMAIPRL